MKVTTHMLEGDGNLLVPVMGHPVVEFYFTVTQCNNRIRIG